MARLKKCEELLPGSELRDCELPLIFFPPWPMETVGTSRWVLDFTFAFARASTFALTKFFLAFVPFPRSR